MRRSPYGRLAVTFAAILGLLRVCHATMGFRDTLVYAVTQATLALRVFPGPSAATNGDKDVTLVLLESAKDILVQISLRT